MKNIRRLFNFAEQSAPSNPPAGYLTLYPDTAHRFHALDSSGVNSVLISPKGVIGFVIDGGGLLLTAGAKKAWAPVPYDCTITKAVMLGDVSGTVALDVWKDTYTNFPPTIADTIVASAPPTLTTSQKSTDSTLTGWSKDLTEGDILEVSVNASPTPASITRVILYLFMKAR